MALTQIDFSKTLTDDQIYNCLIKNYGHLGKEWTLHQWNWMNYVYAPFKDHTKYFVLISLIEKTLKFYDQVNIDYTFDEYYSKNQLHIEKFSITEICEKLSLPKETVRRKVLELEAIGILKRKKKQIVIDRSAFTMLNPNQQLKVTARYISLFAKQLPYKDIFAKSVYSRILDVDIIENIIKKNFSVCLMWFYKMQIPIMLSYNKFFSDMIAFHIWGTVFMNQVFNHSKSDIISFNVSRLDYNKQILSEGKNSSGLSAMSISDMTNIPRATVIRKCKTLIEFKYLNTNKKKQFVMSGLKNDEINPHQAEVFKLKAKFLRKMLNLIIIS